MANCSVEDIQCIEEKPESVGNKQVQDLRKLYLGPDSDVDHFRAALRVHELRRQIINNLEGAVNNYVNSVTKEYDERRKDEKEETRSITIKIPDKE